MIYDMYIHIYVYLSLVWLNMRFSLTLVFFFHGIVSSHQLPSVPSGQLGETAGGFGNGILNFDSAEELRQASAQELKRSFGEEKFLRWRNKTFGGQWWFF